MQFRNSRKMKPNSERFVYIVPKEMHFRELYYVPTAGDTQYFQG